MKKFKGIAFILIFVLALAGCGEAAKEENKEGNTATVEQKKTEYKEESITYPGEQVFYSTYNVKNNPDVFLFDLENSKEKNIAYQEYLYQKGEWVEEKVDDLNATLRKEKISSLSALERDKDGRLYGLWADLSGKGEQKYIIYEFTEKKAVKCKDVTLSGKNEMRNYKLLGDDRICVMYEDGSVCIRNLKDGSTEKEFGSDFTTMEVVGDSIYAMNKEHNTIVEIDIASGEKGGEYAYELTNQGIAFCEDEEYNVYACTEKGIFRLDEGGKLTEIINGSKMSMNALSSEARIDGVRIGSGEFIVTYLAAGDNSREYKMFTYSK